MSTDVVVVSYDQATNQFTVLDPYLKEGQTGPIQVSPEQLEAYMEGDGSANAFHEIVEVRP